MRNLLVTLLSMYNTERSLAVADECAASVSLESGEIVGVSAKWGNCYSGLLYLNLSYLLKEYFCLAGEVLRE